MKPIIGIFALVLLSGCEQRTVHNSNAMQGAEQLPSNMMQGAPQAKETANVALPDDRAPLAEPKGPIGPKSAEAAGQVVQHYGALIEQNRWAEAESYWRSAEAAAAFAETLKPYGQTHLEIGKPGDSEGAAGSIYLTVPVIFYGDKMRRAADVILRRVNDVPGSTEAQRRWHIERIDWKA
jgi:hypothetical protein